MNVVMEYVLIGLSILIALVFHELAHGYISHKLGDPTPSRDGRLTLNPMAHLDLFGTICMVVFHFGWAKPVQYNPLNFKKFRKGIRIVSVAGVLMNVFLGLLAAIIYSILLATVGIGGEAMLYVYLLLELFMMVNSALAIFNFLPIMPLDGYNFVTSFMKKENAFVRFNMRYGTILLFSVLIFNAIASRLIGLDLLNILYYFVFTPIKYIGVLL